MSKEIFDSGESGADWDVFLIIVDPFLLLILRSNFIWVGGLIMNDL